MEVPGSIRTKGGQYHKIVPSVGFMRTKNDAMTIKRPSTMSRARYQPGGSVSDAPRIIPVNPLNNRPMPSNMIKTEIPIEGNTITAKAIKTDSKPNMSHRARLHPGSVWSPNPLMRTKNPITISEAANRRIIVKIATV